MLADLDPKLHDLPLDAPAGILGKVKNRATDRAGTEFCPLILVTSCSILY
jgi:hypothetical protein